MRKHHPDKNNGNPSDRFLAVQQAWEVLSDPMRRERYDADYYPAARTAAKAG